MMLLKSAIVILFSAVLIGSAMVSAGCTRVQIQETMKEYKIIIRPGDKIRPRTYESGDGNIHHLDTEPNKGNTLMIIIRGRM